MKELHLNILLFCLCYMLLYKLPEYSAPVPQLNPRCYLKKQERRYNRADCTQQRSQQIVFCKYLIF